MSAATTLYQFDTVDQLTRARHVRSYYAHDERAARHEHRRQRPREWISGKRVFERRA